MKMKPWPWMTWRIVLAPILLAIAPPFLPGTTFRENIGPAAYGEENSNFVQVTQLVVKKGYKDVYLGQLCGLFHLAGRCKGYQLNNDNDDEVAKVYGVPSGWKSSINVYFEPGNKVTWIILADHDDRRGFAFLTSSDGALKSAAVGATDKQNNWQWSESSNTDDLKKSFSSELAYWSAQQQLDEVRKFPDRKD
jgi:hypothetical protein